MGRKSKAEIARLAWLAQVERWIEEGRPQAIMQDLIDNHRELWNKADRLKAIDRAVVVAAGKGPEHLVRISFEQMLATYVAIQLRLDYLVHQRMGSWEDGGGSVFADQQWQWLRAEQERVHNRICQVSKTYASVLHVMGLRDRAGEEVLQERVLRLVRQAGEPQQRPVGNSPEARVG